MTPQEKKEFEDMKRFINALKNNSSIPLPVDQSFRKRFKIDSLALLETSTKSASSENRAVDEAGAGVYSVLKPPQAFLQFVRNGQAVYIPIYTAP